MAVEYNVAQDAGKIIFSGSGTVNSNGIFVDTANAINAVPFAQVNSAAEMTATLQAGGAAAATISLTHNLVWLLESSVTSDTRKVTNTSYSYPEYTTAVTTAANSSVTVSASGWTDAPTRTIAPAGPYMCPMISGSGVNALTATASYQGTIWYRK
jgi:hypothetical protein